MAGLFIAFEGGEGAGKTTQSRLLAERFTELEIPCLLLREPGGTELGEYLRAYLKSERPLAPEAELLLFEAARVELVTSRLLPALEAGTAVVADRFYGSTVAYQGHGRRIDLDVIASMNGFASQGINPDLTFLLDLPPEEGLKRTMGHQMAFAMDTAGDLALLNRTQEGTRFEELDLGFHHRARDGFLAQARANPDCWRLIRALQPVDAIGTEIWKEVERLLGSVMVIQPETLEAATPQGTLWPQGA